MNKPTGNRVRVEQWNVRNPKETGTKVQVTKIATRVEKGKPGAGQFHGSTNFRGSVVGDL